MKKNMWLLGVIVLVCIVASVCGIYMNSDNMEDRTREMESDPEETNEIEPAVKLQEPCVGMEMRYTCIRYNEMTGTKEILEEEMPPAALLGLRRKEVIDYLQKRSREESRQSKEAVHIYYELISMSAAGLTIKETILANQDYYECFVIAEGEFVNIYAADRTTLYLDTILYRDDFAEEVQTLLAQGLYMKTAMDLYDFLQNHSS